MIRPLFILGAPRSGTTFLASLLNKTVYGPPFETQFIVKYYKKLSDYGDLNNFNNFNMLINDILKERAVMQWDLKLNIQNFFNELDSKKYSEIVDKLCLKAAKKNGFEAWGDKTPHYIGDLDILYHLFPDSKFLYIVRDGRDVALSILKKDWGPNNVYYSAKYWVNLNKDHKELEGLKKRGQLYFMKYEELIDNVGFYIRGIYKFLGMNFSESDVDDLSKSVKKGNYNKWKLKLSSYQISVFEKTASKTLRKFNYECSHDENRLPVMIQLAYRVHHLFYRVRHLFVVNILDGFKIKFLGKQPFSE